MTTGKRIRDRRIELGLSVPELAALLGKNRATVYRYESDDIESVPAKVISELAKALSTTPAYLMGWTDDSYDYESDPDSRFDEIPQAWMHAWLSEGLSSKEIWARYQSLNESSLDEHLAPKARTDVRDYAKNEHEKEMLLLARHMEPLPKEDREILQNHFKSYIDIYLKAKGLSPTED